MRRYLPILPLLAAIAACQQDGAPPAKTQPTAVASSAASAAAAKEAAGKGRKVSIDNGLDTFEYSYPAAAAAVPRLKTWLDADLEARKKDLDATARKGREDARKEGFPYHPFGAWVDWKVVAQLPDWISLSASIGTYLGGAHPNHAFETLLWDKRTGNWREPVELFTSKEALSRALRPEFCRRLDRQRAKKRGKAVRPGSGDPFDECIDPLESMLALDSSTGDAFDRIVILVAPYAAGPYVEGSYNVTLPVTDDVLALVRPKYRRYFAVGR